MKRIATMTLIATAVLATGCTRIETGEVGVRVGFDKQVKPGELMPGSFNQTLIGDVITFPVKDVSVEVNDLIPVAKDNSTMADFDMTVIYNINPSQVAELYSTKSQSFHVRGQRGLYLMMNYISQTSRNAVYKVARDYEALDMNDNRQAMEQKVREIVSASLKDEKLDGAVTISQVQIRKMQPAQAVIDSANALVRAKNEFKQKEVEVKTAEAEARRMAALANQSSQSIQYMQAQAALNISEGIKNGKVNTIVVPANFNALMLNK